VRFTGSALLLAVLAQPTAAQESTCRPGKTSNEARTMASFDVPLAFAGSVAPSRRSAWSLSVGLEVSYLPKIDSATGTPTICRSDKPGPENTDLLFAAPRPRIWLGLPGGFSVEGSWLPPIRLGEVKANLLGLALSRTTALNSHGMVLDLRAHATLGVIKAPITCDDAALQDAASPCYQGTRSSDAFHPNVFGLAASVSWPLGNAFRPYLGAGYNHLAPRFQVSFTNRLGSLDRQKVIVDLERGVLFAGATWTPHRLIGLSGELYSAPVDAVTFRLTAQVRLGP
jgi:hypothetical protein